MYSLLLLDAPDKERSRIGSTSDAKILKTTNFTEFFKTNLFLISVSSPSTRSVMNAIKCTGINFQAP